MNIHWKNIALPILNRVVEKITVTLENSLKTNKSECFIIHLCQGSKPGEGGQTRHMGTLNLHCPCHKWEFVLMSPSFRES